MIKVTKMMKVTCDKLSCDHHISTEVEFDGFNGVNVDFLKESKYYVLKTDDKELQLCADCFRKGMALWRAFMEEGKK